MAERVLAKASHGRGGAGTSPLALWPPPPSPVELGLIRRVGNIGPTVNDAAQSGLTTPTIKSNTYTTGRGGSGNMKQNDPRHPEIARKSQDVTPPVKRKHSAERGHTGRGGAANIIHPSIDEVTSTADERALIEEGMTYDRERKQAGGAMGDWWRDEMATGAAVRRR
ncbi:MAG: hypothetical protein Q9169_003860 [Polycauliona sp. 2 TL-2023]